MIKKLKNLFVLGMMGLIWLTACSPTGSNSTPTLDLNSFRTEVAETVFAQVTESLAQTPSVTPQPSSTATTQPTVEPSLAPSVSPNATEIAASSTAQAETENKAQWVSQSIADDTIFAPGEAFTMTWRLKNTGTSTWTTGYMLRYFSGDTFGAPKEILLDQEVLPGGEIDININMKAPTKAGVYRSDWVMANELRSNFKEPIFLKIIVAVTVTPNPTSTSTLTPTLTRTPTPTS
jgi:hypothetical protein